MVISAIHIGAHVFNVERFFVAHSSSSDVEGVLSALSNLDDSITDQTYLNPVRNSSEVRSNRYEQHHEKTCLRGF